MTPGFALWITGRPAAGKSTIAVAVAQTLSTRRIDVEVLESDALRRMITPQPTYTDQEREIFYAALAVRGEQLARHGVAVIFDATAHRRIWRDRARQMIARFAEVYVACPDEVCRQRDPKGIYRVCRPVSATGNPRHRSALLRFLM